jgi:Flp pilus assembly protein protease CpaA
MLLDVLVDPVSFPGWLALSLTTLGVLTLFVELSGRKNWQTRDIYGFDSLAKKLIAIGGALALGLSGYWMLGITFGFALTLTAYALILSTFTDIASNKAPREISFFASVGVAAIALTDYFILQIQPGSYLGFIYLAVTVGTLVAMFLTLRFFAPNGLGMADVRILVLVGLLSYWLGPVYILFAILIASFMQAILRISYKVVLKKQSTWTEKSPFIPALTFGAILAVLPGFFTG